MKHRLLSIAGLSLKRPSRAVKCIVLRPRRASAADNSWVPPLICDENDEIETDKMYYAVRYIQSVVCTAKFMKLVYYQLLYYGLRVAEMARETSSKSSEHCLLAGKFLS